VTFSPDSRRVATGDVSGGVVLWDVATGAPLHRFAGHRNEGLLPLASAAFVPWTDQLVTIAATDPHALVWDIANGRQLMRLGPHKGPIDNVAVSPDGRWIATASTQESAVYVWDARSGKRAHVLAGSRTTDLLYSVLAFAAGGRQLVTRTTADTIVLWDVESGTELRRFRGHGRETLTAAVTVDGRWLATGGPDAISVLWNLADPGPARRLQRLPRDLPRGVFSPDGRWVAARDGDRAIVLDVGTGKQLREFLHGARVNAVAFSADGRRLATGGADRTALVWDVGNGAIVRRFPLHDDFVSHVEFAADGSTLTTATGPFSRDRVVWDLLTDTSPIVPIRRERNAATAGGAHVLDIAYSADGRRYATTTLDDVNDDPVVWDRRTGTQLHRLRGHHAEVQTVAFSADGRWVVTGDREGIAIVWDAASGALIRRLVGHTDTIEEIAISPDAKLIATASDDQTVVLWDAETGTPLQTFEEHARSVANVSFSPDGRRLLTSAHDGVLMLLDIDVPSLAAQACRALDPGVSAETWARIVGRRYPASCR
jgi:WD40 repeat protein